MAASGGLQEEREAMERDTESGGIGQHVGRWSAVNVAAILVLLAVVGALPFWLPLDEAAGLMLLTASGLVVLLSAGWLLRGLLQR